MGTLPSPALRSLVAGLGAEAFAAFVSSLYEARGYEVERRGDRLVATSGDERVVLYPLPARLAGRWRPLTGPGDEVTVVVGNRRPPRWASDVVDVTDLDEMLRYGVSPADRDALFRAHFGRSPEPRPADEAAVPWLAHRLPAPVVRRGEAVAGVDRPSPNVVATLVVLGFVVVALLTGGGLLGAGGPLGGAGQSTGTPSVTPTVGTLASFSPTATPTPQADVAPFPAGVDESGVTNVSRLVVGHVQAVGNDSYELRLGYRAVGENHTGEVREVVRRTARTEYVTAVERHGEFAGTHWPVADREAYANGERRYVRLVVNGSVRYRVTEPYKGWVGRQELRAGTILRTALEGAETRLVSRVTDEGTTFYRLAFEWPAGRYVDAYGAELTAVDGVLLVSESGVVRSLRWSFVRADTGSNVVVEWSYERRGVTTVEPPTWLEEAHNATT